MKKLYNEFLIIAKELNSIDITPVLYGSLGLSMLLNIDLKPQDIDILIPENFLKTDWNLFKNLIEKLGYKLVDLHEHEFKKEKIKIAFATQENLKPFANVDHNNLEIVQNIGAYKQLSLQDYLKVYTKSSKDSYRKDKNNDKDATKINIIKSIILKEKITKV
ncbi:MAG: hypothetical protein WAZ12_00105 [Candidatus Absconditicoccaceae bacterium]